MPKCHINNYIFIIFFCAAIFFKEPAIINTHQKIPRVQESKLQSRLDKRFMARVKSENWLV